MKGVWIGKGAPPAFNTRLLPALAGARSGVSGAGEKMLARCSLFRKRVELVSRQHARSAAFVRYEKAPEQRGHGSDT